MKKLLTSLKARVLFITIIPILSCLTVTALFILSNSRATLKQRTVEYMSSVAILTNARINDMCVGVNESQLNTRVRDLVVCTPLTGMSTSCLSIIDDFR